MADENVELELEDGGAGKSKLIIIIVALVVVLAGAGAAAFFLLGDDPAPVTESAEVTADEAAQQPVAVADNASVGTALYVAMPRPFVFNVTGSARDRLVQIKVQLLVRGGSNEALAQKHIPLIESTLLKVFASATAEELSTVEGKEKIRSDALSELKSALSKLESKEVVEQVLFTGFVMQ